MPPPFDETVHWMLKGALMSYAPLRGFEIESPAGDFFAKRAADNIKKSEAEDLERYSDALIAIINLPEFINLMERTSRPKAIADLAAADAMINAILGLKLPCVYPWCRSRR